MDEICAPRNVGSGRDCAGIEREMGLWKGGKAPGSGSCAKETESRGSVRLAPGTRVEASVRPSVAKNWAAMQTVELGKRVVQKVHSVNWLMGRSDLFARNDAAWRVFIGLRRPVEQSVYISPNCQYRGIVLSPSMLWEQLGAMLGPKPLKSLLLSGTTSAAVWVWESLEKFQFKRLA